MTTCAKCGKTALLPYKCEYCGESFCVTHRLPESHDCDMKTPPSPPAAKKQRVHKRKPSGISLSD